MLRVPDLKRDISSDGRTLNLVYPIPPSVNKIHYTTKGGGRRLTGTSEKYIRDVRALTRQLIEEQQWELKFDNTWYYMDMVFYFPDRRIRDSHNCLKILLDALEGYVFNNDYMVCPRILSVEYDKEYPRVEVIFREQSEQDRQNHLQLFSELVFFK